VKIVRIRFTLAFVLVLSASIVAGCGGAGGDGGQSTGPEATPVFDVEAAIRAMFDTPATYEMTGSVQIGSTASELHETDTFTPGAPADSRVGDFLATELARTVDQSVTRATFYYTESPFRLVALKSNDSSIGRYTRVGDLPSGAFIGQSGELATFAFDESSITSSWSWMVEAAEVPETAWVCLVGSSIHGGSSHCLRVGANGAILGARVVSVFGFSTSDLRSPLPSR